MKVKVCGITNNEDALLAVELGASAVGFIFYPKSKRYIDPGNAAEIIKKLPPFVTRVGVFVNSDPELINDTASGIKLHTVQLHGDESPEEAAKIKLPVIKSLRIGSSFDYSKVEEYGNHSILLDTYSELQYGGTGRKFDWSGIPEELRYKIILAGGINAENLNEIVSEIKPYAVDVSSSLESEPGIKDEYKMENFFNTLKLLTEI